MTNKYLLTFCCIIGTASSLFAQQPLPIVHASSSQTYFTEGKYPDKNGWQLAPEVKPDVYEIDKSPKATWVHFHTDIDSLRVQLKPGETFDFIVLLNGTDSCYTRIESPAPILRYANQHPATHDTIPFVLAYNNIHIKVLLNQQDSLNLYFDSGGTGIVLTHEAIAKRTHLLEGKDSSFTTRDYVRFNGYNVLQIGTNTWDSLPIYPVSVGGQETDGHFGWDLFDGRMVEFDYDNSIMIIHSSLDKKPKGYSRLKIAYRHTLFCIDGKLVANGNAYSSPFLFDTGYQRSILLDSTLRKTQGFPKDLPVIKESILRNGAGKIFRTQIVNSDQIKFGKYAAPNIPTQLLNTANPARFPIHILGNELLKRFNTILDFQHHYVYLKPNGLMDMPYTDAS